MIHLRSLDSNRQAGPLCKHPGYKEATRVLVSLQKTEGQGVPYIPAKSRTRQNNTLDPELQTFLEWLSFHWAEYFAESQNSDRQQPCTRSAVILPTKLTKTLRLSTPTFFTAVPVVTAKPAKAVLQATSVENVTNSAWSFVRMRRTGIAQNAAKQDDTSSRTTWAHTRHLRTTCALAHVCAVCCARRARRVYKHHITHISGSEDTRGHGRAPRPRRTTTVCRTRWRPRVRAWSPLSRSTPTAGRI